MPIWRTSELPTDRPGSPARRRSASTRPHSSRAPALPQLRNSADGSSPDEPQPAGSAAVGPSHATCHPSPQRSPSGCSSVNSFISWEGAPPASSGSHGPTSGAPPWGGLSRQTSRPDSRGTAVSAVIPGVRSNTYTVQYIGIANGELGILSQKQKLTVPVTVPGAAPAPAPASNVVVCRRHSRASAGAPALAATAAAAAAAVRPPLPPSRPGSSFSARPQLTAIVPDPTDPGPIPQAVAAAAAAATAAAGGATDTETDDDSPGGGGGSGRAKPPSLASIVDDAHGQIKVISECFYSRALQSRGGPRDRHARRNRPMGPQVRDMEPLSTALPGRFGSRAPSAGGFPGWKLTAAAAALPPPPPPPSSSSGSGAGSGAPRWTYSGAGSGYGTGTGFGSRSASRPGTGSAGVVRQKQQQQQQRAGSAWPAEGTGTTGVTAVAAAAAAASSP
ncbi:hypothetical protein PLESTB_001669600 [Pleodorina starrii]|uniref:Uncharacterized protein n=1 Tax=Pleodorina starrii TaxID=330485 RepID=A0A9W6F8W8_9CHLO|nr:hypothetical protein PLESTM_000625000 [Pleodorina starrii]GLC60777.1 hypothetical protein PLESTB_001669600 [Pleodorina starrii]GLC75496.1 hypothetical protein PLESTF_001644000 [Pleodorina starrii]